MLMSIKRLGNFKIAGIYKWQILFKNTAYGIFLCLTSYRFILPPLTSLVLRTYFQYLTLQNRLSSNGSQGCLVKKGRIGTHLISERFIFGFIKNIVKYFSQITNINLILLFYDRKSRGQGWGGKQGRETGLGWAF